MCFIVEITGPKFFEDEDEKAATINSTLYHAIMTEYFLSQFDGINLDDVYYREVGGATCHIKHKNIDELQGVFENRVK